MFSGCAMFVVMLKKTALYVDEENNKKNQVFTPASRYILTRTKKKRTHPGRGGEAWTARMLEDQEGNKGGIKK